MSFTSRASAGLAMAMLVALVTSLALSGVAVAATWDFDNDGNADILWRNLTDHRAAVWRMNGSTFLSPAALPVITPAEWIVVGVANFTGGANADLLWWRPSTGEVSIWRMSTGLAGVLYVGAALAGQTVAGVGDVDGDGDADIVWRDATGAVTIWFMNGAVRESTATLGAGPGLDWTLAQVADFNGDGTADLLWRRSSGEVAIWFLDGATVSGTALLGTIPLDWTIVGVGDLDGNARADILWRQTGGLPAIWLFSPTGTVMATGTLPAAPTDWAVVGVRDFDGDGNADILWRHADGRVAIWRLNGFTLLGSAVVAAPSIDWHTSRVEPAHAPTITSPDNVTFTEGVPGTFFVTTMGFPEPSLVRSGALPAGVTFTDNGNGTATLAGTPGLGTQGPYNLSLTADNDIAPADQQDFVLNVVPNTAPTITEGPSIAVAMDEDGAPVPFSLTLNATDTEGGPLTWSISTPASDGTANASGTGASKAITYTPSADFNGADSFVVQVADAGGLTDTITVNVTIREVNDSPVPAPDSMEVVKNRPAPKPLLPLDNDSVGPANEVGQSLIITGFTQGTNGGTVTIASPQNVSLSYQPAAGVSGIDTFTYDVCDNGTTSGAADPQCVTGVVVTVTIPNACVPDGEPCGPITGNLPCCRVGWECIANACESTDTEVDRMMSTPR